jgi:hypothetical protein
MSLNKHMMLEAHALEQDIEALTGEGGAWEEEHWWEEKERDPPTAADLARAEELKQRLAELRKVQHDYNTSLGGVSDGKPAPGVSPRFYGHVKAFERIQNADKAAE